jgi:hypothetical protein
MLKATVTCLLAGSLATWLCACSGGGPSGAGSSASIGTGHGVTGAGNGTPTDVVTYHNDAARTGQNLTETELTPGNVSSGSFGLLRILAADGVVDATPLVVSNLSISGAMHDVVYVATENDTVYAYDENSFTLLAQTSLLGSGETAASIAGGCNQVSPQIGVTATPVIDRSAGPNGTLFVVAMSQDAGGSTVHRLHALDLVSLKDRITPVVVQATYPGNSPFSSNGTLTFTARQYKERSALLLSGGQIYTSWASNCDINPYNAWIMSYSEFSLAQTQVINLTPNGTMGAMWNAGGLLADGSGSIYALLGNGTFDAQGDYGNAAVKLTGSSGGLTVADYFAEMNTGTLSASDIDFGSGTPMLLPDQTDASGTTHQLMFAAGKDGNVFVLDRSNLGQFNANVNNVFQQLSGALPNGVYAAPAYFNGSVYVAAVGQPLTAFKFTNAQLSLGSRSSTSFASPGASPAVSANGTSNGIVWATESGTGNPAVLHAYNPANLAQEYYNSRQAPNNRDSFGTGNKYITPVIANGRVLVATPFGVAVFGPF